MEKHQSDYSITNKERYRWFLCETIMASGSTSRMKDEPYMLFWKRRRNAKIAQKKRLRMGPGSKVLMDMVTMDIVTDAAIIRDYSGVPTLTTEYKN